MSEAIPSIVPVMCKMCSGGKYGEKAACLVDIKIVVEDGDIAYMLYSEHVREKVEALGYKLKFQYIDREFENSNCENMLSDDIKNSLPDELQRVLVDIIDNSKVKHPIGMWIMTQATADRYSIEIN